MKGIKSGKRTLTWSRNGLSELETVRKQYPSRSAAAALRIRNSF